jgi:phosphoglycolate phosphatase
MSRRPRGPRGQPLAAAIVDLDGTMVDTLGDFEVALGRALADLGHPPVDRDFIARTVGKGSEHLILRTLEQVGAPASLQDAAWSRYQAHYLAINGRHSEVYPGVVEGLHALRAAGLRLACLTNKPRDFALPLLAAKGLAPFFEQAFGGDDFARKKPDPLPLLETCRALGTTPAQTLMIGDSSNDVQAARAAGCPVVLVSYGYNHGEPVASAGPDGVVDRLDALAERLLAA